VYALRAPTRRHVKRRACRVSRSTAAAVAAAHRARGRIPGLLSWLARRAPAADACGLMPTRQSRGQQAQGELAQEETCPDQQAGAVDEGALASIAEEEHGGCGRRQVARGHRKLRREPPQERARGGARLRPQAADQRGGHRRQRGRRHGGEGAPLGVGGWHDHEQGDGEARGEGPGAGAHRIARHRRQGRRAQPAPEQERHQEGQGEEARPLDDVERSEQRPVCRRNVRPSRGVVEARPGERPEGAADDGRGDDAGGEVAKHGSSVTARRRRGYSVAMQSISTSELPGMPPAAAIVVRTGGSEPKRPRNISFIAA
jgi:hypothetical protein